MIATALSPIQEHNIQTYLSSMPADVQVNIESCKDKWLKGETSFGYPHPVQVCDNLQTINARQPFLTAQQSVDLHILKSHLQQALQ